MLAIRGFFVSWIVAIPIVATAADRAWEFQGDFVSLKPGNPAVAIFQLPDKTRIEVPLAALSEADRAAIRQALESGGPAAAEAVTARGPLGKSVTLVVPAAIKAVETDAIWCRDAADAVLVYELYLAGDALSAAERSAAEARLTEWRKLAAEKRVRQGAEWVTPEARSEARRTTDEMLQHALQLLKLGNTKLAEAELEKASRLDPEDGRAEFILGLAYALTGSTPNAVEHFADALRRDPEDPWIVSNLAVCEFMSGRYGGLAGRFREILDIMPDAQLVADNLGVAIVTGGAAKPKMPDRIVGDLNDLYRQVVQMLKLKAVENVGGRKLAFVTPYGKACTAGPANSLPAILEPPREWVVGGRAASGVVIAAGRVLTTRRVLEDLGEVWIEDPVIPGRRLPAIEMASLEDPPVTLLKCDDLATAPLPVAAAMPAAGVEVLAAIRVGGPLSGAKAEVMQGKVVSPARPDIGGRFVHSAAVSRGPGGGPIVDASGRLVGLVAHAPRADASGNMRGLGIPVDRIWPLLKEQLADLEATQAPASTSSPDVIASQVPASTVRVVTVEKRVKPRAE
jgi:tetratricopeptide (TPR) repeat protein